LGDRGDTSHWRLVSSWGLGPELASTSERNEKVLLGDSEMVLGQLVSKVPLPVLSS